MPAPHHSSVTHSLTLRKHEADWWQHRLCAQALSLTFIAAATAALDCVITAVLPLSLSLLSPLSSPSAIQQTSAPSCPNHILTASYHRPATQHTRSILRLLPLHLPCRHSLPRLSTGRSQSAGRCAAAVRRSGRREDGAGTRLPARVHRHERSHRDISHVHGDAGIRTCWTQVS